MKPPAPRTDVALDGAGESTVDSGKIDADTRVRCALNRQAKQALEEPAELKLVLQRIGKSNH